MKQSVLALTLVVGSRLNFTAFAMSGFRLILLACACVVYVEVRMRFFHAPNSPSACAEERVGSGSDNFSFILFSCIVGLLCSQLEVLSLSLIVAQLITRCMWQLSSLFAISKHRRERRRRRRYDDAAQRRARQEERVSKLLAEFCKILANW